MDPSTAFIQDGKHVLLFSRSPKTGIIHLSWKIDEPFATAEAFITDTDLLNLLGLSLEGSIQTIDIGGAVIRREAISTIIRMDYTGGSPDRIIATIILNTGQEISARYNRSPSYDTLVMWWRTGVLRP